MSEGLMSEGRTSMLVISTSRSESGQLAPLARLAGCPLVVCGMHLDSATPIAAEIAGIEIIRLPRPADSLGLVHQVALRELLATRRPEVVFILGDRFELLELVLPLVLAGVTIAHLSGGERTAGAIDDVVRNAISQVATRHYPAHELAAERLVQMGIPAAQICVAGEPGLDAIRCEARPALDRVIGAHDVLVALHPVTRDQAETEACISAIQGAAARSPGTWHVSTPNGDPGSERIRAALQGGNFAPFPNRGAAWFRAMTAACGVQVGNSSAGLVEAPSLGCATVDIGHRQHGRPRGASVVTLLQPSADGLLTAVAEARQRRALATPETNPYGDGHTCARILAHLCATRALGAGAP
jgi:UDP-hydrolysing UDP-N-acetyl-D-glucosamine 2-epimerase